jgi:hypothetical protein
MDVVGQAKLLDKLADEDLLRPPPPEGASRRLPPHGSKIRTRRSPVSPDGSSTHAPDLLASGASGFDRRPTSSPFEYLRVVDDLDGLGEREILDRPILEIAGDRGDSVGASIANLVTR